jgi:hypothetical protein
LFSFIVNKRWMDSGKGKSEAPASAKSSRASRRAVSAASTAEGAEGETPADVDIDEDEEELDKQDEFEAKYNFRFEQEGAEQVVTYPRILEDSVRVEKNARKEAREKKAERKEKEVKQKTDEKKTKLKAKKSEIDDRIKQIALTTGIPGSYRSSVMVWLGLFYFALSMIARITVLLCSGVLFTNAKVTSLTDSHGVPFFARSKVFAAPWVTSSLAQKHLFFATWLFSFVWYLVYTCLPTNLCFPFFRGGFDQVQHPRR